MPVTRAIPDEPLNPFGIGASLAQLADSLPDGMLLFDHDWRLLYANRRARSISQIEDHHLLCSHWEIWPDTVGQPLEAVYRQAMVTRIPQRIPAFFYAPLRLWLDIHLLPIEDGIAIYYRDITEEQRLQKVTEEANRRTQLALAAANGVGVWDWDVATDLIYADAQFADFFGVDPDRAAAGAPFSEFMRSIHAEDLGVVGRELQQAVANRSHFAAEYRIRQPSGAVLWVSSQGRCTTDARDAAIRFSGIAIDISARKRTEAVLVQSEKLAAVGRMASSIAHEINNPLESVTNLLFLAQQYAIAPEVKHYLALADQELRRISIIANQTLRFHKQSQVPRDISPEKLFSTVLSLYAGRLRNSGIIVCKQLQDLTFSCFEGDIRQVLNNLVGNAIDAMPEGGTLHLRSRPALHAPTGRAGVLLTVADTGDGIPAGIQPHIFDAFFTTKGNNGNGLGLWISKGILDRHEGLLRVRSRHGHTASGSIFSMFLPSHGSGTPSHATAEVVLPARADTFTYPVSPLSN